MKLAQVIAGAPTGGAELFFERLTIALHRAGDCVLPVIRRNADRASRLADAGLQPTQLRFGGPADLFTARRLRTVLRRFVPRVVLAWMNRAARFAPRGDWVLAGRLGGYYDLDYYRKCDHLIGNTQGIAAWIVDQGWPAHRVHYLPNFAEDLAGARPVSRASLGIPDNAKVLLALGRLHRNKGFDILIRALPMITGIHTVIAGEGPERAALGNLAVRAGVSDRLHLPGWRTDSASLLATADVLVCPSRHEPLGNVVIEAWSAGCPVVAADSQGPTELIRSGHDGVLVPKDDPGALARAVSGLLDDAAIARSLAEAGRARFQTEFTEAPVVARWRRFLGEVEKD
ncbi:MAG: glycosyltransferase [Acetobacteraceae bacterium]|nr:glycosyltransferase [Acetobacteraceae bacterium]